MGVLNVDRFSFLFFNLAAILEKTYNFVSTLSSQINRQCVANMSPLFLMHHCIGATNQLAPIKWCCKHKNNPRNTISGAACLRIFVYSWNRQCSTNIFVLLSRTCVRWWNIAFCNNANTKIHQCNTKTIRCSAVKIYQHIANSSVLIRFSWSKNILLLRWPAKLKIERISITTVLDQ